MSDEEWKATCFACKNAGRSCKHPYLDCKYWQNSKFNQPITGKGRTNDAAKDGAKEEKKAPEAGAKAAQA